MSTFLTDQMRSQFDSYYKSLRLPQCQKCGTKNDVIPSVTGRPTKDLIMYAQEGQVKLTECCASYKAYCKKCQTFIERQ